MPSLNQPVSWFRPSARLLCCRPSATLPLSDSLPCTRPHHSRLYGQVATNPHRRYLLRVRLNKFNKELQFGSEHFLYYEAPCGISQLFTILVATACHPRFRHPLPGVVGCLQRVLSFDRVGTEVPCSEAGAGGRAFLKYLFKIIK